jgi:uncharacterized glyoxalase superfamily protein PhnB
MRADPREPIGTIVPTLRYRDVGAAIDWLCNAFGFAVHHMVSGDDGAVRYAELTFGSGMIMLAPVEDSGLDKFMTQPEDAGGAETQICYLFVADATAHCERAREAGAEIVLDIEDAEGTGRGYSCRDLEGHIWNFGTYDPWKRQAASAPDAGHQEPRKHRGTRKLAAAAALFVVLITSAIVGDWALGVTDAPYLEYMTAATSSVAEAATGQHRGQPVPEREAIDRAIKDVKEQLARERTARETAERHAREAQAQLTREQGARESAERTSRPGKDASAQADTERLLEETRQQLVRQRAALEAAQRVTQEAREQSKAVEHELAAERKAREAAEAAGQQARLQLAKETAAKDAAEKAAKQAREEETRERAAHRAAPRARPPLPPVPNNRSFINWDRPSG